MIELNEILEDKIATGDFTVLIPPGDEYNGCYLPDFHSLRTDVDNEAGIGILGWDWGGTHGQCLENSNFNGSLDNCKCGDSPAGIWDGETCIQGSPTGNTYVAGALQFYQPEHLGPESCMSIGGLMVIDNKIILSKWTAPLFTTGFGQFNLGGWAESGDDLDQHGWMDEIAVGGIGGVPVNPAYYFCNDGLWTGGKISGSYTIPWCNDEAEPEIQIVPSCGCVGTCKMTYRNADESLERFCKLAR